MQAFTYQTIHLRIFATALIFAFFHTYATSEKCLKERVYPKYSHYNNLVVPITIRSSKRISNQVATYALEILLQEFVGYQDVKVVYLEDNFTVTGGFTNLRGKSSSPIPNWMLNLEVWVPTSESLFLQLLNVANFKEYGNSGSPGTFGWFIPRDMLEEHSQREIHLTTFLDPKRLKRFNILEHDWVSDYLLQHVQPVENEKTFRNLTGCLDCKIAMFTPDQCLNNTCAVILAPTVETTSFIVKQIKEYELYMRVVWVGEKLREVSQKLITALPNNTLLILSWSPSHVIHPASKFMSVSFPTCRNELSQINIGCEYEQRRLAQIIWKELDSVAHYLLPLLGMIQFKRDSYDFIYNMYNENPYSSSENVTLLRQISCAWLQEYDIVNKSILNNIVNPGPETVHLGVIYPQTGSPSLSPTADGIKAAAEMAEMEINDSQIIPDYKIQLVFHDGHCESNHVIKAFIEIHQYENLLGILGPACSETVEPLAGVSKLYNLMTISYSAEGVSFTDRKKYPGFFRTIGENAHYIPVYQKIFDLLHWKQIFALTEDGHKYTEYLSRMSNLTENKKFPRHRGPSDLKQYLEDLKHKRARIIIMDVLDDAARAVMCEAYQLNMTARHGYVWFLPAWFSPNWYDTTLYKNENTSCTTEMMIEAINGYFTLSHAFFGKNESVLTMDNRTTVEDWRKRYVSTLGDSKQPSDYAAYTYDAVWTYAFALKELLQISPPAVYELKSSNTSTYLSKIIEKSNFYGASGHINFANGASRMSVIEIKQWINHTSRLIGTYEPKDSIIYDKSKPYPYQGTLKLNKSDIIWLAGETPKDGIEPPHICIVKGFADFVNLDCEIALLALDIIAICAVIIVLAIIIYTFKRKYEEKLKEHQKKIGMGVDLVKLNSLDKWEIPRDQLVLNRKLGQGAFGTVYGGEAYFQEKGWVGVAVKTLKIGSTTEEKLDFLSEAEVMKRFDHKNIVKLLAVCTQAEPVLTIMEFMLYGDLKTFLLARRHLVNEKSFEENDEISSKKLTSMAIDVARALSYLAKVKFVHRDVAARNCLLNQQRMVKLGDFGMTRQVFENDYYKFNRKGMLPVRWMAPESLGLGLFTPSSDVWSYGVLLYEIITFGSFPFQGKTNTEVLEFVKKGNVLKIPSGAKPQLEGLIKSCWNLESKNRPKASEIVEFLASSPRLLTPCLDFPTAAIEMCNSSNEMDSFPASVRKCSVNEFPPPVVSQFSFTMEDSVPTRSRLVRQQSTSSAAYTDDESFGGLGESIPLDRSLTREPLLGNAGKLPKISFTNNDGDNFDRRFSRQGSTVSDYRFTSPDSEYIQSDSII